MARKSPRSDAKPRGRRKGAEPRTKTDQSAWQPSPKHWAYFVQLEEAIQTGTRISDRTLAQQAGLDRRTIASWREDPGFLAWVEQRFELRNGQKQLVLARATSLAIQGSIDHMKFLAQVLGWFKSPDPDVPQTGGTTVLVAPPGSDAAAVAKLLEERKPSVIVRV